MAVPHTVDGHDIPTNYNVCPNDGTAALPPDGVVFVENATSNVVTGANPFDGYVDNSVTNLTSTPNPQPGHNVTLTATVTSASNQISSGATVSFSQTTSTTVFGHTTTNSSVINGCSTQANWTTPVASGTI